MAITTEATKYIDIGISSASSITVWVGIALLILGIGYLVYWMLSFRHTVIIKEKVGESFFTRPSQLGQITDRGELTERTAINNEEEFKIIPTINSVHKAKIIVKKTEQYIQLFAPNKKLKLPNNFYQSLTKKGKKWIELLKVDENLFYPIYIKEDSTGEVNYKYDADIVNWAIKDIEQDHIKYKSLSFMDKYGSMIMIAGTLAMVFLILAITYKYSNGIVDKMAPLAQSFSEAAKELAKAQSTQVLK